MYIPLQTLDYCFALGIFDSKKEAEDAYIKYLASHDNFDTWFKKLIAEFNQTFYNSNLIIKDITDFRQLIFNEHIYNDLSFDECELMQEFWEERNLDVGNLIREVSDNYPQRDHDAMDLAAHLEFSYDEEFGNHCNNLLFSIMYQSESKFTCCFENYIERMAKRYPIF